MTMSQFLHDQLAEQWPTEPLPWAESYACTSFNFLQGYFKEHVQIPFPENSTAMGISEWQEFEQVACTHGIPVITSYLSLLKEVSLVRTPQLSSEIYIFIISQIYFKHSAFNFQSLMLTYKYF
jgi:hypothetical protein